MNDLYNIDQEADSIPFDPTGSTLTKDTVGEALRELASTANVTASPGYTWGRSGTIPPGTYLLNDSVPSNKSGRVCSLTGAIEEVAIAVETSGTFTFSIETRSGIVFTEIGQVTMTGVRVQVFDVSFAVTRGAEICVRVRSTSSGSPKEPTVALVLKGSIP